MEATPTTLLRDALYTGVGFGLITFQKAQVRRREITAEVEQQVADLKEQMSSVGDLLQTGAADARDQIKNLTGQ